MTAATPIPSAQAETQTADKLSSKAKPPCTHTSAPIADTMRCPRLIRGIKNLLSRPFKSLPRHQDQVNSGWSPDFDYGEYGYEIEDTFYESSMTPFRVGPYFVSEKLGAGSFGSVHVCKHRESGQKYAGKLFNRHFVQEGSNMKMVFSEVDILKELSHDNTLSFVDLVFSRHGVLLVMDLVNGTDITDIVPEGRGIVESFARIVFKQLLKAIQHIHSLGIIHRDIKIENVMVDKRGTVKLVDYGLAEKAREGMMVTGYCGTRTYYSPELAQCEIDDGHNDDEFAGDKIDIWAAGVFLYTIASGEELFDSESKHYLLYDIAKNNARWNVDFSPELTDLLKKILRTNPEERLSIKEILAHPWMRGVNLSSSTKETFQSESGRVQIDFDKVVKEHAASCPKIFPAGRDGAVVEGTVSMANLVDWRDRTEHTSATHMTDTSETSETEERYPSLSFNFSESSEFPEKEVKRHFKRGIRPRMSGMRKLIDLIPSLLRRKRRCRQLMPEDIAQVW